MPLSAQIVANRALNTSLSSRVLRLEFTFLLYFMLYCFTKQRVVFLGRMADSSTLSPYYEDLLAQAATHSDKAFMQWFEAALKVHAKQSVAQILATTGILRYGQNGATALHLAAHYGHDLVAAQLLADSPELAHENDGRWNALRLAVSHGRDKVVAVLLAMSPASFSTADRVETVLHTAARQGYDTIVAHLLAVHPGLASEVDCRGWNALHVAVLNAQAGIAETLLAHNPGLIHSTTPDGDTVLHLACMSELEQNKPFYARLLGSNPAALRAANCNARTPFEMALVNCNECAMEVIEPELIFDEIVNAFIACEKMDDYEERFRPIIERQCECFKDLLNQDVVGIVFEYLGFEACKRT